MPASEMDAGYLVTLGVLCVIYRVPTTDGLVCYACPRTPAAGDSDANIECLATGWELSCAPDQDRCYSTTYRYPTRVAKGCTTSANCVDRTACCSSDLCNADPVNSLAGYGNPCEDISGCIQGSEVMACRLQSPGDRYKVCLCVNTSFRRGATCKRKSFPDEACTASFECRDVNSECISRQCKCPLGMFPNNTRCDMQKQLGETCTLHKECIGRNTQCNGQCSCMLGYIKEHRVNQTVVCSGAQNMECSSVLFTLVVLAITDSVRQR